MKAYRLHYDSKAGKILGYYPYSIAYDSIPSPCIDISEKEYDKVLNNESKFRVQNRALVDISDTAEYQTEELGKIKIQILDKISSLALNAKAWGVIVLDETCYANVSWKDYYANMLSLNLKSLGTSRLKTYVIESGEYMMEWKEFLPKEANSFLKKAVASIDEYINSYIPNKQAEYLAKFKELENATLTELSNFLKEIDYGFILDESKIQVKTKFQ